MSKHLNPIAGNPPKTRNLQPLQVLELPDALLRMTTLAQASGLSVATLYRKAAAGELELVKIGLRCTRVRASVAREFIQTQGQPVSPATVAATVNAPAAAPHPAKVHDKRAAFEAAKAALGARGGTK